jgi:hypothetical protein
MYYDKLYFIYQAIANLQRAAETGSGEIGLAEAGVYKGGTCYFMAAAAEALGMKKLSVHAFDTFEGHHPQDVDPEHAHLQPAGAFANVDYEAVKQYLRRFEGAEVHKGRFQDTCSAVAHRKFHVVHLDINLYDPTLCALQFFDERLVRGGTIVVDDYGSLTNPGVRKAVDDFLPTTTEYFKVHLLTNQCLLMKTGPAGGRPVEAAR